MHLNKVRAFSICITVALGIAPLFSFAGDGGGRIGNGGSLAEQNIELAYEQLPKIISSCLNSSNCELADSESLVLAKIREIALKNERRPDKILFLSGAANPGFFSTGVNEPHRIAKTELNPDAVIYFNTDLISENNHSLTVSEAAGILVHEVGHQAGETDHRFLDKLGAKIRDRMDVVWVRLDLPRAAPSVAFEIFNYPDAESPDVLLIHGAEVTSVTKIVSERVTCPEPGMARLGYSLTNGNWAWPATDDLGLTTTFHAWVNLHCLRPQAGTVVTYYQDLTMLVRLLKKDAEHWDLLSVLAMAYPGGGGGRQ